MLRAKEQKGSWIKEQPSKNVSLAYAELRKVLSEAEGKVYPRNSKTFNTLNSLGLLGSDGHLNKRGKQIRGTTSNNGRAFAAMLLECISEQFPEVVREVSRSVSDLSDRCLVKVDKFTKPGRPFYVNLVGGS
jgi:hypothetical protein